MASCGAWWRAIIMPLKSWPHVFGVCPPTWCIAFDGPCMGLWPNKKCSTMIGVRQSCVQSRKAFVGAHGAAIMGLVEAEGFAWVMSEQDSPVWAQAGLVPSTTVLDALDAWWRQQSDQDVYACDQRAHWTGGIAELDATFDAQVITEGLGSIAGVLAVKVYVGHQWQRAYWFKPEVVEHLTWAGNPNKPMQEDSQAQGLSPRRSFEQWVETKRGVSAPFLSYDDLTARRFLHVVGGLWREV